MCVVCPALNTQAQALGLGRGRRARAGARSAFRRMLDALDRDGFTATGDIGDGDPVQAIEDGLRMFGADEVIVSTHPPGRSNWLERDVVRAGARALRRADHARGRGPRARARSRRHRAPTATAT